MSFSEPLTWVRAPVRSEIVNSWRAPPASAVNAAIRSRGWSRTSRGESTATIRSIVKPPAAAISAADPTPPPRSACFIVVLPFRRNAPAV